MVWHIRVMRLLPPHSQLPPTLLVLNANSSPTLELVNQKFWGWKTKLRILNPPHKNTALLPSLQSYSLHGLLPSSLCQAHRAGFYKHTQEHSHYTAFSLVVPLPGQLFAIPDIIKLSIKMSPSRWGLLCLPFMK